MNSAGRIDKISETLWEHHRPTIERLYLKESKRLNAIDAYMRRHHKFIASKSQYEKNFKRWGWRKNLTAPEWRAIIRYIKERIICIDDVEVYFHGNVLSKERIEREKLRYGQSTISHGACKLPEGVEIAFRNRHADEGNALSASLPEIYPEFAELALASSHIVATSSAPLSSPSYLLEPELPLSIINSVDPVSLTSNFYDLLVTDITPLLSPSWLPQFQVARSFATHVELTDPALDSFEPLATILAPTSIPSYILGNDQSHSWLDGPFSWTSFVDWDFNIEASSHTQQSIKQICLAKSSIDTAYIPLDWMNKNFPRVGQREHLLSAITSLLNNTDLHRNAESNDAYKIFRMLPRPGLIQKLKALPTRIRDALTERVFAAAIMADDGATVSAMLSLDANPHEHIRMNKSSQSEMMHPLEFAVCQRLYSAAEALLRSMCQNATQKQANEFFDYIFTRKERKHRKGSEEPEMIELICPILAAGACPVKKCFSKVYWGRSPLTTIQRLFDASSGKTAEWLQLDLLEEFLWFNSDLPESQHWELVAKDVLQYIFLERLKSNLLGSLSLGLPLLTALCTAQQRRLHWAIELILPAMWESQCYLDDDVAGMFIADESFNRACSNGQWLLGTCIMLEQIETADLARARQSYSEPDPVPEQWKVLTMRINEIEEHISRNDLMHVDKALSDDMIWDMDEALQRSLTRNLSDRVEQAVCLGRPLIAISIIQTFASRGFDGLAPILVLFRHSQTTIATSLLREDRTWCRALETATRCNDFGTLEALIYQRPSHVPYVARGPDAIFLFYDESERRQMHLRLIAFYAIETDNRDLCTWLFEIGMDASELIHGQDTESDADVPLDCISHRPYTPAAGAFTPTWRHEYYLKDHVLPSLVATVAEQNRVSWISFLFAKVGHVRDSMALFRAVKARAEAATIRCLLVAASARKHSTETVYGSAALRQAVRYQDFDLIAELCEVVDIDAIERTTEEHLKEKNALSPMGEAILMDDPDLVGALLKHGADSNTPVAHGSYQFGNIKSILPRMSPLLAAIDMHSLPIVQLLVDAGAELHYKRALGIFRTPLQRAAEVGNLDILQYLISKGASMDTTPKYSSATELQLAAMNGFVGVATYLIGLGATVNHPPAEGEGRTAFEAGAENGRIDMMLLLVQSGVQLQLEFGNPPESQYVRAKRFAEKNGFMAAKRFVESLFDTPTTPIEELQQGELQTEDALSLGLWPSPTLRMNHLPGLSP
ncbi:hypothetical protein BKA63DRAFT_136118 [Paraphoma chrysanthemicola]|nr:hypothetical protein BKA63DRAFT_136118 [Paraphoma chrysanthemicola]